MTLFGNTGRNARLIGTALLVITFVAGALAGAAVIRVLSAESKTETAVRKHSGSSSIKGSSRRLLLDSAFAKEIGLTADQRAQIVASLDRRDAEAKALWHGFEPQLKAIGHEVHSEIAKILTAEQQQKLDAALEQHRGERRKRRECSTDSTKAVTTEKAS